MNTAIECMKTRRSIRKYKPDMVPDDLLQKIAEAGTYAASGMGRQPSLIVVVRDRGTRDKLSEMNAKVLGAASAPFYGAPVVIVVLADKGRQYIKENPLGKDLDERISAAVSEYRELFEKEKDFIAQYTEQATGVVPVFLSIRKNDKILFKIHVIVPDVETADKIQRHWTENAQAAYESTWKSIAGDLPMPVFD